MTVRATTPARISALVLAVSLVATSCSLIGGDDDGGAADEDTVTLVAHDSFALPDDVLAAFEEESGYTLEVETVGDAGTLTNELIHTEGSPLGDVAFGIDNTFGGRAVAADVLEPYTPADLPASVADYDLPGDDDHALTPVDSGNVCVNIDDAWFAAEGIEPPRTLDDLTDPTYRGLFVTPSAAKSSPGLAFLLATIAEYGEEWPDYWERLLGNDAKIASDWENAYTVDFTTSGGKRPIVVSYDSSPAFTVTDDGESSTSALLETCFRQVEYAGVIAGTDNPEGAQAFVDFLLSQPVQKALPESMYVFPVVEETPLPREWARFAKRPTSTLEVGPAEIDENREEWLQEWNDLIAS